MEAKSRREFAAALAPLFVPRSVWGANDRPAFGSIGTGSRGRFLHETFQQLGARCVAICDVYEPYLEEAAKKSPADVRKYVDHHRLLEQKGIDFVVIATPDHHHCPMLLDSLAAGKDVYLEKPLSHSLEQSAEMVKAVRKTDRIVQIGMHRRSMEFVRQAKKIVDDGALGRISMVKALWNWHFDEWLDNSPLQGQLDWERFQGPAPRRPLEPRRFRWWRGFWDYSGGNMTDQGTHLMDVVQWMTNSPPPRSAVCQGRITNAEGAEVPNIFTAVFEYPDFIATWTLDYRTAYDNDWSIQFLGEKAAMVLDQAGLRMYADPGSSAAPWTLRPKLEPIMKIPDTGTAAAHMQNFLDCIGPRKEPNCPVEVAAAAVTGPHMANLAFRQGKRIALG